MSTVFGIDIRKGNIKSTTVHPRFSLTEVEDGRIVSEEKSISIPRLFRLMRQKKPAVLAVDSVQEIAGNDAGLWRFMASMPAETSLVQVTGDSVTMESLPVIAARYNLKFDKTNPAEEARVSALIASYGGGYEVLAFEGVTTVIVSRARSPGHGGWSQNRYVRKIHGGVKTKAREIEVKLKEAGLSYTTSAKEAFGGVSRILFEVKAERAKVPVASARCGDIQIRVIPKRRDKILYVPRDEKNPYVIVGVDPGTTVGVAVLGLDGTLLHLESVRAQSPAELISVISGIGIPVLVATDKAEMPAGVEKIRRVFGAVGWTPKKDVLIKEKYAAAKEYAFADDHQRDSLSAALMAYKSYLPKFENIRRRIPRGADVNAVFAGIIRGKTIDEILVPDEKIPETAEPVPQNPQIFDEKDLEILRLEGEVLKLRKLSTDLSKELEAKDTALRSLQKRVSQDRNEQLAAILRSEEITSRDRELEQTKKALRKEERRCKNLRLRLERMKRYIALTAGDGALALKVLQQFSRDEIRSMDDEMGITEDDILYILKIDGWGKTALRDLAEAHVRAVIFPKHTYAKACSQHLTDAFREINLPALSGADLSPRVRGKIGIVDEEAFCRAESAWKNTQDAYLKDKQTNALSGMVSEYQVQRKHDVMTMGIDPATWSSEPENAAVPLKKTDISSGKIKIPKTSPKVPAAETENKDTGKVTLQIENNIPKAIQSENAGSKHEQSEERKTVTQNRETADKQSGSEKKDKELKKDIITTVLDTYRKERQKELMQ